MLDFSSPLSGLSGFSPAGRGRRVLARPAISIPSAGVGQTAAIATNLSVQGGLAAWQYRWATAESGPISGATTATYVTTSGEAGENLYLLQRQSLGGGKWSRWFRTNSIAIAAASDWIMTAGDGQIEFVSTPSGTYGPADFTATAGDGSIIFEDAA